MSACKTVICHPGIISLPTKALQNWCQCYNKVVPLPSRIIHLYHYTILHYCFYIWFSDPNETMSILQRCCAGSASIFIHVLQLIGSASIFIHVL